MSRVTEQFEYASQHLAGGVCSSTRVNQAVGHAMYFKRASGCRVWDLDDREYIDLCCSHGATLIGHGDPRIRAAIVDGLENGAPCSYESEIHGQYADLLCQTIPCLERIRVTGSGTEATLHCIRLARAFTGRKKILRFEGNFHGYHDQFMYVPNIGADGWQKQMHSDFRPGSAGVAAGLDDYLIEVPYNHPELLAQAIDRHGADLAAVICEPVFYNAGCVQPTKEFINAVRTLTEQNGTVLIFDEVLSAFRMCVGGAQQYLGVTPDLCTVGKSIGGTMPLSVFGGKKEIMDHLMPAGTCQHSGTYNGHVLAVSAAMAALQIYRSEGFYPHIFKVADKLYSGMQEIFDANQITARVQGLGARFGLYFGITEEVTCYRDALQHCRETMLRFIASAMKHGVYFHDYGGVACHHGFCAAMSETDADEALSRLAIAVEEMA